LTPELLLLAAVLLLAIAIIGEYLEHRP